MLRPCLFLGADLALEVVLLLSDTDQKGQSTGQPEVLFLCFNTGIYFLDILHTSVCLASDRSTLKCQLVYLPKEGTHGIRFGAEF